VLLSCAYEGNDRHRPLAAGKPRRPRPSEPPQAADGRVKGQREAGWQRCRPFPSSLRLGRSPDNRQPAISVSGSPLRHHHFSLRDCHLARFPAAPPKRGAKRMQTGRQSKAAG
jgi:hypothetical protein